MADDNEPNSDPVDMASPVDAIIEGAGDEPPPDTVVFGDVLRRSADLWPAELVFDEAFRGEARLDVDYIQRPIRLNYVSLHEPAYLRTVSSNPYPEISKALTQWHANDGMGDPVRVFPSWRNYGGGRGRGWDVELAWTHDNLWTWDSWTAALVVLAGIDDRAVGVRRCPDCRGRGLVFRWFASIDDGLDAYPMHDHDREWSPAGGLGGVLYVSRESGRACIGLRCGECRGAKTVDVRLLELVFFAAQGWPWALEHGGVIADQLQAAGDPWGLWLAALLEPRVWGGWVAYPTRRAVTADIVQRLDEVVGRRQASVASRVLAEQGELVGLVREPDETDDAFRSRILASVRGQLDVAIEAEIRRLARPNDLARSALAVAVEQRGHGRAVDRAPRRCPVFSSGDDTGPLALDWEHRGEWPLPFGDETLGVGAGESDVEATPASRAVAVAIDTATVAPLAVAFADRQRYQPGHLLPPPGQGADFLTRSHCPPLSRTACTADDKRSSLR